MRIFCCACDGDVEARLTDGAEIYPHRRDLARLPFWRCDSCRGFVGCHHKMRDDPCRPLGVIPTPALRAARRRVHAALDPLWESGRIARGALYARLSGVLGREYHTADLRSLAEVEAVVGSLAALARELSPARAAS